MGGKLRSRLSCLWRSLAGGCDSVLSRARAMPALVLLPRWCAIACSVLFLLGSWQLLFSRGEVRAQSTVAWNFAGAGGAIALAPDAVAPLAPMTLGMDAPAGTEELGREFLLVGHSDRLLDREVGERLRSFWPLRELITAFNRDFVAPETPLIFTLDQCSVPVSSLLQTQSRVGLHFEALGAGDTLDSSREQHLTLCYDQLQAIDDYADDLSGSLTEQHLAVLDMVYFLLDRELSRLLVAIDRGQGSEPLVNIKPLESQTLSPWLEPQTWESLPEIVALDQLTAVLPQRLALQQRTGVVSGAQWLFNQGNPLLEREQLGRWTKDAFSLEVYQRLICTAEAANPKKFPFLDRELPAKFAVKNCPEATVAEEMRPASSSNVF